MSTLGIIETSTAPKSATTMGRLQGIHTVTVSVFANGCKRRCDSVNALQPGMVVADLGAVLVSIMPGVLTLQLTHYLSQ